MKKYLILSFLFFIPACIFAQGPISFGPKVGWNSSTLSTDYQDYLNQMQNGVQGGLFFSIYMDKLYVQPEAYFSIKRGTLDTSIADLNDPTGSLDISQTVSISTVDIPLLLGFKLLDLKLARLRVWGGPVASYVLNKSYTLRLNGDEENERISSSDFKDAVWGFQVGAGLDILFLTFDIGYEFGLEDFMNIASMDDLGFKNNVFYVSMGWRIF